jgi:Zn-dependent protease/CBS domain-containing protein
MGFIAALLLFASLLLHELSHSYIALKNDLKIQGITLFIFGGVAHMSEEPATPSAEFKMAAAGPLCSLILSLFFWLLTFGMSKVGIASPLVSIFHYLYLLNAMVAVFNLVPAFPLDGGRILRAALWFWFKDLEKSTQIASSAGKIFAYFLMFTGLLNIFGAAFLTGIWLIFIGLFLLEAAEESYRQLVLKGVLSGLRVMDIMTPSVIHVDAKLTLDKLVDDYIFRYRHHGFPVTEDDELRGMVTLHAIKGIPKENWPKIKVAEVMHHISPSLIIMSRSSARQALKKISQNQARRLMVIEDHKLVGIVTQRDILRIFELKSDLEGG